MHGGRITAGKNGGAGDGKTELFGYAIDDVAMFAVTDFMSEHKRQLLIVQHVQRAFVDGKHGSERTIRVNIIGRVHKNHILPLGHAAFHKGIQNALGAFLIGGIIIVTALLFGVGKHFFLAVFVKFAQLLANHAHFYRAFEYGGADTAHEASTGAASGIVKKHAARNAAVYLRNGGNMSPLLSK